MHFVIDWSIYQLFYHYIEAVFMTNVALRGRKIWIGIYIALAIKSFSFLLYCFHQSCSITCYTSFTLTLIIVIIDTWARFYFLVLNRGFNIFKHSSTGPFCTGNNLYVFVVKHKTNMWQTIYSFLVSHETCLLDQVLELIINEKPPTSASLFLNEDTDKPPLPERGDLRRRLRRAMERRASNMKERMSSISRACVKGFLKRNLFVLFTIAAVALGEWRGKIQFNTQVVSAHTFVILCICVQV